ncbi:MAG: hypothetical protein NC548_47375 [Lachnospiraceae bacterium]|nr:hypothetical protein [Lachnospiraceae bacterium]
MYRVIKAALDISHSKLIRKLEDACRQYAEAEYGFGFVGSTPVDNGMHFTMYTSKGAANRKDQNEVVSNLWVDMEDLQEDDLRDPDYFQNSVKEIVDDMCNNMSGNIEKGPAF